MTETNDWTVVARRRGIFRRGLAVSYRSVDGDEQISYHYSNQSPEQAQVFHYRTLADIASFVSRLSQFTDPDFDAEGELEVPEWAVYTLLDVFADTLSERTLDEISALKADLDESLRDAMALRNKLRAAATSLEERNTAFATSHKRSERLAEKNTALHAEVDGLKTEKLALQAVIDEKTTALETMRNQLQDVLGLPVDTALPGIEPRYAPLPEEATTGSAPAQEQETAEAAEATEAPSEFSEKELREILEYWNRREEVVSAKIVDNILVIIAERDSWLLSLVREEGSCIVSFTPSGPRRIPVSVHQVKADYLDRAMASLGTFKALGGSVTKDPQNKGGLLVYANAPLTESAETIRKHGVFNFRQEDSPVIEIPLRFIVSERKKAPAPGSDVLNNAMKNLGQILSEAFNTNKLQNQANKSLERTQQIRKDALKEVRKGVDEARKSVSEFTNKLPGYLKKMQKELKIDLEPLRRAMRQKLR